MNRTTCIGCKRSFRYEDETFFVGQTRNEERLPYKTIYQCPACAAPNEVTMRWVQR